MAALVVKIKSSRGNTCFLEVLKKMLSLSLCYNLLTRTFNQLALLLSKLAPNKGEENLPEGQS